MHLRVIVTGSRAWPDPGLIIADLWSLLHEPDVTVLTVAHGNHWEGADLAAQFFCEQAIPLAVFLGKDVIEDPFPAAWNALGRRAGPVRDKVMVAAGGHLCLAYRLNGVLSKGTTTTMELAEAAGILVVPHERSTLPDTAPGP